jgi:hypothetical protein
MLQNGTTLSEANEEALEDYNQSGAVPYKLRDPSRSLGFSTTWNWWNPVWCRFRSGGPTSLPSPLAPK